uniref:GPN-loop GTPase 3 n=1 Tax=Glossina austeni TaxID=7395 RepID=A0A1A9VF13_GLOAU
MRYAQLVIGPAGSGKSTYCTYMQRFAQDSKRLIEVVNLDPAAEHFDYQPAIDIRDLIQLDDAMEDEELRYGPNGGLVFCLEFLIENQEWLKSQLIGADPDNELSTDPDGDYILFDMPGQIELFTHLTMGKKLVQLLESWNFRICTVFLVDSQFMIDGAKFLSGTMAALSVMANLEMPHVNVLTKMDLLSKSARKQLDKYLDPDPRALLSDLTSESAWGPSVNQSYFSKTLVRFIPMNIDDEDSLHDLLLQIDNVIQYGEDGDVKIHDFDPPDNEKENDDSKLFME